MSVMISIKYISKLIGVFAVLMLPVSSFAGGWWDPYLRMDDCVIVTDEKGNPVPKTEIPGQPPQVIYTFPRQGAENDHNDWCAANHTYTCYTRASASQSLDFYLEPKKGTEIDLGRLTFLDTPVKRFQYITANETKPNISNEDQPWTQMVYINLGTLLHCGDQEPGGQCDFTWNNPLLSHTVYVKNPHKITFPGNDAWIRMGIDYYNAGSWGILNYCSDITIKRAPYIDPPDQGDFFFKTQIDPHIRIYDSNGNVLEPVKPGDPVKISSKPNNPYPGQNWYRLRYPDQNYQKNENLSLQYSLGMYNRGGLFKKLGDAGYSCLINLDQLFFDKEKPPEHKFQKTIAPTEFSQMSSLQQQYQQSDTISITDTDRQMGLRVNFACSSSNNAWPPFTETLPIYYYKLYALPVKAMT